MAEKACHVVAFTAQVGLIQALGRINSMSGCALRATGSAFSPAGFLERFPLPDASHRGDGLNVLVSDKGGDDLAGQVQDALVFLQAHAQAVQVLCKAASGATLDFGLWRKDTLSQSVRFPPELVVAAGNLGLGLEASIYTSAP